MTNQPFLCQRILLTNDDGIHAPGIAHLKTIAEQLASEVWVVAPAEEKSGASQSVTPYNILTCTQVGTRQFSVTGSPADCVAVACAELMKDNKPDLILSGINRGGNLGNEVAFSGTVGAAMTGLMLGIPAIALSQTLDKQGTPLWETALATAPDVIRRLWQAGWPADVCLSVNFPPIAPEKAGPLTVTTQGVGHLSSLAIEKQSEEAGSFSYKQRLVYSPQPESPDAETTAISSGKITITPLCFNRTNEKAALELQHKL